MRRTKSQGEESMDSANNRGTNRRKQPGNKARRSEGGDRGEKGRAECTARSVQGSARHGTSAAVA
ncbi:hypothetical protein C8Q80DRAFT_1166013 [Daedaleopsis nitida]|nr:hypothetical protein C8Q80DRAFT_1166013 [Daedaleopsis nitida]